MINNILRSILYFVVFVMFQVLFLNNIHYLRIATPFLYLYCIIKMPIGISRSGVLIFSFITGLIVDMFSNTPGMHAGACALVGLLREPLIHFLQGEDIADGFYFTIGYPGMTGGQLAHELMYYGVSAICLSTTGSCQQGLRICTSFVEDRQIGELDRRMAIFNKNNPV